MSFNFVTLLTKTSNGKSVKHTAEYIESNPYNPKKALQGNNNQQEEQQLHRLKRMSTRPTITTATPCKANNIDLCNRRIITITNGVTYGILLIPPLPPPPHQDDRVSLFVMLLLQVI